MAEAPRHTDPFAALRAATSARIGLGRAGAGLPTGAMLALQLAHAHARDAVHAELDADLLLARLGSPAMILSSAAPDKAAYLQNPDLGRSLDSNTPLLTAGDYDLAIVLADGLSARALESHAPAVVSALTARLTGWRLSPLVLARRARVAIGDQIGRDLGAKAVVILIGERPGLSSADSLSAYITWAPKPGRRDSERNCVSNIRDPGGLHPENGANKIAWLLVEARRLGFTGVNLKDRQDGGLWGRDEKGLDDGAN